jgi:putative flippase GtrA
MVAKMRTPTGQKLFRYSMASVVALVVSNIFLLIFYGLAGLSAVAASTLATAIGAIPSYEMNRRWAWGKTGRSHLWKEVVPFWALAFVGWAFATYSVDLMEQFAVRHDFSHTLKTGTVILVYIGAFGVLWIVKFIIFNKLLFGRHHHEPSAAPSAEPGPSEQARV